MKKIYLDKTLSRVFMLLVVIIVLTFIACAPQQAPAPESKMVEKPVPLATQAGASWEQQWEELIKAARKEGRLYIYSGLERATLEALRDSFSKKYDIAMDIVTAKGAQLQVKVQAERSAGLFIPDVYVEGPGPPLEWKYQGIIVPLDKVIFRPDILNEELWGHGGYGTFFDREHFTAGSTRTVQQPALINTKMVRPGEITSYNDLLEPQWKGKIIFDDPTIGGGTQYALFSTLTIMGEEYIAKLAGQMGEMSRDKRLVVEWVARGKYPLAFVAGTALVLEFIKAGANVNFLTFKEGGGTTSTGLVALFDRAPNPNAAKLFVNWFLTKEGQEVYSLSSGLMSRRLDVSNEHLLPSQRMIEGAKYVVLNEEFLGGRENLEMIIAKYYKRQN